MQENNQKLLLQIQTFEDALSKLQEDDSDYKGRKIALEVFLDKAHQNLKDNSLDKLTILEAELEALRFKQNFIEEKLTVMQ